VAKGLPKRSEDYAKWYTELVLRAQLADYAPVKGCMVIRPYGYALWERMQGTLDRMFKETGHVNAYFPLFIPESFMRKEAEHVTGFAPQCAVVTHGGGAELEEPLYIRPTSETVIWAMYARWIQSWRDLPILINQWANVVRWEMRTRLFLRTTEFLWQEGHTAHSSEEEAVAEAERMLEVYRVFAEEYMAIPVHLGVKSESEKFAGAVRTYCIEAMMQDGRALQAGTSHYLGQNFARAFDVRFQDRDGRLEYVYATSWGVSTRLVGALVMAHSDDDGLVLPPRLAPIHAVIVPIVKSPDEAAAVGDAVSKIKAQIQGDVRLHVDDRENVSVGWKFNDWELRGVPVRIEIGPRELRQNHVVFVRRDSREKKTVSLDCAGAALVAELESIQKSLYDQALARREKHTHRLDDYSELKKQMDADIPGFVMAHWCGNAECEARLQEETKATIRCIPLRKESAEEAGRCIICGEPSPRRVLMAKAY